MNNNDVVLEGLISVRAAMESGSRPLYAIWVAREKRDYDLIKLARAASEMSIPIERLDAAEIDARAGGKTHGGVIALAGDRRTVDLAALLPVDYVPNPIPPHDGIVSEVGGSLAGEAQTRRAPFIVMLDGVEDPFNYGQAIRAFYAAGADGLVTRARSWENAAGVVARASAGASERMPTAITESVAAATAFYRARGLTIAVATEDRAEDIDTADLSAPLFILIGGEKRGITRSYAEGADVRVRIPYGRPFDMSLGTTAAAAVVAFAIARHRKAKS